MWDAKKGKDKPPVITRLNGVKKATSVSVGEMHLVIVGSLYHPTFSPSVANNPLKEELRVVEEVEEIDVDLPFDNIESNNSPTSPTDLKSDFGKSSAPSLKFLCEKVAMESLVEPRNAIQMLEIADSLQADHLKRLCEDIAIHNLDYIVTVSLHSVASAAPEILAKLKNLFDTRSSEPWSYRRLPTPTATLTVIINSDEEGDDNEVQRTRDNHSIKINSSVQKSKLDDRLDSFLQTKDDPDKSTLKQVRASRKKLQQIEMLEAKLSSGHHLDDQQLAKLQMKSVFEKSLAELGAPVELKVSASVLDGKGNRKGDESRKYRRKCKHKLVPLETVSGFSGKDVQLDTIKSHLNPA